MGETRQLEPSDFEGSSLEQMRGWVEGGAGADPLYDQKSAWEGEQKYLTDLAERVNTKLGEAGVVMQSKSGEAMQGAVAPVVLWTEVTAENARAQAQLMSEQGDAFKKVQSSIPASSEEQSVPDDTWIEEGWDSMWNGQTDAEAAKAHNEKLRQEAVTAFNNYDSASQSTVGASAVFTPPPPGGMETTVSGGQHTGVGGMTPAPGGGTGGAVPAGSGSAGYSGGGAGGFGSGGSGSGGSGGGYTPPSTTTPNWDGSTRGPGDGPLRPGPQGPSPYGPNTGIIPPGGGQGPNQGGGTGRGGSGGGRGPGVGAGGRSGGGVGAGSGRGALGPGGQSGVGAGGRAGAGVPGAGGAGGRGGAGAMGGAGARGRGQEGEEDLEHETPDYLKGDHGFFDDELPKVAPPVFGDWNQK
ncbi:PPE-repeat protein [Saccharopolyspora erythraea NRRL 2338]|uniref:PE-PGRS family protein n=2 Tax=Saccharopolyspora erythraea TaxID=1836 RepID=A4FBH8_SACEN|nr:PPE domain-containing protein [Saccharopolyspora erythraea]EQD84750.1 hypothetical protein N599_18530 [Saccharopolyspora erythraea D]PFG95184.1 PPE-repeat protein [Saccharopolyspora erythraea NRRL 2338]QRK91848.1 PPE domain-containing protein [Saccharopolyspora erythraea]CAM01403.1 PE-PGRS family protein [Saccharopolyspora erythraea NRRL 2338]